MSKKIKTNNINDVREQLQSIGDQTNTLYQSTGDLKAAEIALKSYNGAINAAKTQLIYKKLTGTPGEINFFQE